MIRPDQIVAFDVETSGVLREYALQPCRSTLAERLRTGAPQAWLTTCAMSDANGDTGHVRPTREVISAWLESLSPDKYVCCWNAPFDVAWLVAMGIDVTKVRWLDGMLLLRHLKNAPRYLPQGQMSYGLKAAVSARWPERGGYDDGIDFMDESDEGLVKLLHYNKLDARYTRELVIEYIAELDPKTLRAAIIEAASIPLVAQSIVHGLTIDPAAAAKLSDELIDTIKETFVTLKVMHPTEISKEVLASPKQLAELLYGTWGLKVPKLTEKGAASTDKEALTHLALTDPRAKLVHRYREANYNHTKFVAGSQASLAYNGDGVSRPQARIFGTSTGRMTYSSKTGRGAEEQPTGIAIHQWKRDAAFRRIIKPPQGYTLLEFDFAGQEFRWMAVESGDPVMLSLCQPGEDAHSYMGARVNRMDYKTLMQLAEAGDPTGKSKRQLGKVANLSLQYRTSPNTLIRVAAVQYGLALTMAEARAIHATYLTTYSQVRQYWNRQIYKARSNGYVETLAGRRVYLGTGDTWMPETEWSCESTAINFPIQGIGADQKYLAMLVLKDYLPTVDGRFYFELHDGLFVIVPDEKAEKVAYDGRHMLSHLPYKQAWGVDLPIEFPVDGKIGPSWGDLKGLN